jgi:hypothetical protein
MSRTARWAGAIAAVLLGTALFVAAFPPVVSGDTWIAFTLLLGGALVLWCGARVRPPAVRELPESFMDARLGLRLTGIGLGLFLTALLGFFGVVLVVFGGLMGVSLVAIAGLGLLAAGPLLFSASIVLIRR